MNENRVTPADAASAGSGVAGGSIGLTATHEGGGAGGAAGGCCRTAAGVADAARTRVSLDKRRMVLPRRKLDVMKDGRSPRADPRLPGPLVRVEGVPRPGSWQDALDRAADGFRRNLDARGPNALGVFSCSKSTNEVNFLAQKLARVAFGTNNIDSCNRT